MSNGPKYQDITNMLINELNNGSLHQGDRFYSETEICNKFKVSSTTAVKVLNLLQEKNKVNRIQGKGTFVAKEEHKRVVFMTDLNLSNDSLEGVKVISVSLEHETEILTKLNLSNSQSYVKIIRMRYIDKQPSQYSINYINAKYINLQKITNTISFNSVYQRVREDSGLDPYKLAYSQKNIARNISNNSILQMFSKKNTNQLFICQYRYTYLPSLDNSLLEYAVSYKLPQYWGYKVDSTFRSN